MISLSWTSVFFLIFYWASEYEMLSLFIISGTLFPFAKMVCDLFVGFKLDYKIKHSVVWINNIFIDKFKFFIYLVILIFSIPLAPFGIFYLLIRAFRKFIKNIHT